MIASPRELCYDGSAGPRPAYRTLRAGSITAEYADGDLRYVRLGRRELIRRLYVAVRDSNWGTVPGRIRDERIEETPGGFLIRFAMEHRQREIDFAWDGTIELTWSGLTFRMDGRAKTTFRRNRIGFCLLHPIGECAGIAYSAGRGREVIYGRFPRLIAPENPLSDFDGLSYEVTRPTRLDLRFEGDRFEMEDQRNWIDASFKTFCTPLSRPFPVTVEEGNRVVQAVTMSLFGRLVSPADEPSDDTPKVVIDDRPIGALPEIGLGLSVGASIREVARLGAIAPAHLRVELNLAIPGAVENLKRANAHARRIRCGLEVALTVSDQADAELARFVTEIAGLRSPVRRWLLFHEREWSMSERWVRIARERLGRYDASIPLFSGTTANFAELNRGRPQIDLLDGVCYSVHPQEHASDNRSLVETCKAIRDTLETARAFSGRLPIAVTPLTLRKRVNPYATGPVPEVDPDELPPRVDPRQMSLLGAGWTLGSLKSLAEGGAASTTWYETTGWLGVMESEAGCPRPDLFPSRPGMVFPLFHVLADANEWRGAQVIGATSNAPLRYVALALRAAGRTRVLIANLADEPVQLLITGLGESARIRTLDETTFARAADKPGDFRFDPGEAAVTAGGRLDVTLRPFAYARIDTA